MNFDEIRTELRRAKRLGHTWMQFKVRRTRSPKNWDRVRVIRGVYGRCIGETTKGTFVIDVRLDDLERGLPPSGGESGEKR